MKALYTHIQIKLVLVKHGGFDARSKCLVNGFVIPSLQAALKHLNGGASQLKFFYWTYVFSERDEKHVFYSDDRITAGYLHLILGACCSVQSNKRRKVSISSDDVIRWS